MQNDISQGPIINSCNTGPVTKARLKRSTIVYAAVFIFGLFLLLATNYKALGVGLWFPGAGFLAAGGWQALLFPVALILFAISLVAWLGSGMLIAPPIIWLGSAVLAQGINDDSIWSLAPAITIALVVGLVFVVRKKSAESKIKTEERRIERNEYLPQAIADVHARAVEAQPATERELTTEQLASLRYSVDRGLQAPEDWSNFTKIDQFQPAAYRYQLNNLGYTLGMAQCFYTPNFHGYMSEAQRNIIEKYCRSENWNYWRLERLWGSLSTNFDPVGDDNIMLTGFYGINLGLYEGNTGDTRYSQQGALDFRLNDKTSFKHDFHSVTESIVNNMRKADFGLFPCEPNWIYTPCNFRGITTIALHDRIYGTSYIEELLPGFMDKLNTEFTLADGNIITAMSMHTGLVIPMPFSNDSRSHMMNVIHQNDAVKSWAMLRHELVKEIDGVTSIELQGKGVDFGNYSTGHTATLAGYAAAAGEMGDMAVKEAALAKLEEMYPAETKDNVAFYPAANGTRAWISMSQIAQKDDWRNAMIKGPGEHALNGPLLANVSYPDVLVAKAMSSNGNDLSLVLHAGQASSEGSEQSLTIQRLAPSASYNVIANEKKQTISADEHGNADVVITLLGRTQVELSS